MVEHKSKALMCGKGGRMQRRTSKSGGTVFALAGGGNLGAVQVGMLRALLEGGIRPDAVVGTSIGALNGVYLAGHADLDGIAELNDLWLSVHRRDVFPLSMWGLARGIFGQRSFLFAPRGLGALVTRAKLGYENLEDFPIPVSVVATDLADAEAVELSVGPAIEALLASAAIPGVFPPVEIDGRLLVDGGVLADVPIVQADALGAARIFVLPTTPANAPMHPVSAVLMMQRALSIAARGSARRAFDAVSSKTPVYVMPVPMVAGHLSIFDFRQTRRLIDEAYQMSAAWLAEVGREEAIAGSQVAVA
ncbi:MAG: patatin-like phospholipase family protein [Acidimicrobiales bacterium]